MIEDEVRDMLRDRAASVQPSADALERIEAKLDAPLRATPARRLPVLAAAAVLVVIALVGAVLLAQRDDGTPVAASHATTSTTVIGPGAQGEGVWPWPGDDVDDAARRDPVDLATAYVAATVGMSGATTVSPFEAGDANSGEVVFGGDLRATVLVRQGTEGWYVVTATSDLLTVQPDASAVVAERAGSLLEWRQRTGGSGTDPAERTVEAGDTVVLPQTDRDTFRVRYLLATSDRTPGSEAGVAGLLELLVEPVTAGDPTAAWPLPDDPIDASVLDDPVDTARAYVASRIVDVGASLASEYRAGDARSGEVTISGHVSTTVFVRQGRDDRWFVVGSASDLLPVHDAGDGVLVMTADTAGDVQGEERSATGAVSPIAARRVTDPGTELWRGSSGGAWFALDTGDGAIGLAEVLIVAPEAPGVLPGDGAANPRDAAIAYLDDRLDGREVTVDDFTATDATHGEVTWEAGVVMVSQQGDRWFVHEAIGDSIQIAGTSLDVGYIGGSLTLAQAGTVHLSVGDVAWDVRNDVDREHTTVMFEHAVPTDEPVVLRAVFETDTGYVSVAEKVVG